MHLHEHDLHSLLPAMIFIYLCTLVLFQVHGLDAETWKKVDVVYIDIADRSQVEPKVNECHSEKTAAAINVTCLIPVVHSGISCISPGLQARGGSL